MYDPIKGQGHGNFIPDYNHQIDFSSRSDLGSALPATAPLTPALSQSYVTWPCQGQISTSKVDLKVIQFNEGQFGHVNDHDPPLLNQSI